MSVCKYCEELENKQDKPGLVCKVCLNFVHLSCLRRPGTPGDFACDVFFEFTCEDCSPGKKEVFERNKFPWVNVILLTLNHLNWHSYGISNHGYFHYKTHICSFIDRYWHQLFGGNTKQKKNWVGTIAGVLSVYNNIVFRSGSLVLGETGWWKLMHNFSPAVAAHIVQELPKDKPKGRPRSQMSMDMVHFVAKVTEMGYKDLINNDGMDSIPSETAKKRKLDYEGTSSMSNTSHCELMDSDSRNEIGDECSYDEMDYKEASFRGFDYASTSQMAPLLSDSSSIHSLPQLPYYDSDSRSRSPTFPPSDQTDQRTDLVGLVRDIKPKKNAEENAYVKRESLFSSELNSVDIPWFEKVPDKREDLVELSQYEEVQLLKRAAALAARAGAARAHELRRLRARLALRRAQRHRHLPVFDLDKIVKVLGGYVAEDPRLVTSSDRVLDRFQRSYHLDNLCGTIASTTYNTILTSKFEPTPFRSAYSGTLLRPYIRRDAETTPLWLKLTNELLKKANKKVPGYSPPPRATLDYSYVRPQHIAAVNDLCATHFWPGIDLTEALQYPEFSCVVTYKRLVVGCAFLVPDANHNEAYISFILTRPEWRKAKIASFMLYHLLQTCSGKDVTLHVSPTNPAIFLYQKFGFKVEELIQDFYEKYYDIEYKGCRHALFLRLVR
ncbi:cysteine-rich protein 2-binding protein [Amyelois transitella]|uniref:cysteine-rich protein 2-binding protein n=1 Tax=Amyelois transitella TaxID=680683 RepID=UPI00298F60EC|nr:cysteine-rich protein 2-binding protein [Amyelois transitella]